MENFFRFMAAMEALQMYKNPTFLRDATERFDKQALLQVHDDFARRAASSAAQGNFHIKSSYTDPISSAGAACSVPLERLNPISFNKLKVGDVHRGRVVYGTLCAKFNLNCGIMTVLEDDNGLAVRLAIYNVALSEAGIKKLYPKGTKVAIKEPYFKIAIDDGLLIRVDNPANVVKLVLEKDQKRTESPPRVDVEDMREKGNRYFKEQNWDAAAEHYTKCIDAALLQLKEVGSSKNKKMINNSLVCAYSNRAKTWLQMKEFKRALEDSNAVLRIDPRHLKALYSKGRALLGLKLYKAACQCLKKADKTNPGHKEIQEVLGQAMTLYAQSLNGKYDISDYLLGVDTSSPPEVADFVGPVEIKMTEDGRGRGLYATQEISTGQLFLVSNPVAVAHDTALPTLLYSEKTLNMASGEDLVAAVVCAANKSQRLLRQLYSLHHSSTSGSLNVPPIDLFKSMDDPEEQNENLGVDVNRIRDIISLNGFSAAVESFSSKSQIYKARVAPQRGQSGLWLLPSFINHSCLPNSKSLDVGNVMFIHASKPIKKGEEITISYFDTLLPLPQRQAKCKSWGFKCNCRRCILEHSLSASLGPITNKRFDQLHDKATDELNASTTQKQPFDADLPACAEFLRLFVEAEEIIRNSQVLKTEEEKHWIRASFVSAYLAGTHSKSFHSTMMDGCFSAGQTIMKAIQSTEPGDFRNLNMAASQFKDFFRWMGDESDSMITGQASEQAREACISVYGRHSEDLLKALVLKFKTQ